jgi:NADPH:quinone reductase-like Zn-dependent oxidoreductase
MAVNQLFIGPTADSPPAAKPAPSHRLVSLPTTAAERISGLATSQTSSPQLSSPQLSALPQTMMAARLNHFGPPEMIAVGSTAVPQPRELEVLVRVCAAGVGPWDALVRTGRSGLAETLPLTLGAEISGVVEKVGANTTGFAPGDEVFGATNPLFVNGYAEYAVVSARMIAKKTAALPHVEAAAMPVVGVMAWQMLFDHAAVCEGQTVVVHGGAGNVGAYAVQLAHARKLRVIATVRNGDANYVRGLGADEVINTETANFADFARRADAVIDTVGGTLQDQLFTLVKPGGIVVSSVSRPNAKLGQRRDVRTGYFIVDVNTMQLTRLADMHADKELVVPVGSVLPLGAARAAHEMLAGTRAHSRGKIVLRVAG